MLRPVDGEHNDVIVGDGHWEPADSVMSAVSAGVKSNLLFEIAAPGGLDVEASAAAVVSIDPQSRHPPKAPQTPPPGTFGV